MTGGAGRAATREPVQPGYRDLTAADKRHDMELVDLHRLYDGT